MMRLSLLFKLMLLTESAQSILTASRRSNAISRRRVGAAMQPSNDSMSAELISSNWAGMISTGPPEGWNYHEVSASFFVPQPSIPKGQGDGVYSASVWVGIDGAYSPTLWQAGVSINVEKKRDTLSYTYYAWYEWVPGPSITFDGITIKAGDLIQVTVIATSPNNGLILLRNEDTKVTINQTVSSTNTLALQSVEWVVEDDILTDARGNVLGHAPMANWTTVNFLDTYSILDNGTNQQFVPAGTGGIGLLIENDNSTLLSSVSLKDGGGEIIVKCI